MSSRLDERAPERFPRPLSQRERAILDFLLSAETPGAQALRAQAATARVTGRCDCGCATVDLSVDRANTSVSSLRHSPAIEAHTALCDDPQEHDLQEYYELIVFVDDGWLKGVEIVYYGAQPPEQFPPPARFLPPYVRPTSGR